ncbi:helix-turn-helix transcriptional regulator [Burkholderia sp. USMB20]|uniref:helix-turn-helix transcriptional regulator n=1 Tax=Burkholderia sp. USMB20 TaxID=1571773 RepID=UPI0009E214D6|nr:AraC family transcriptional regulator [Burkholderia sp. USMB20]TGN95723.1 AraC family transcriptional regulator [Burkholderia sp. USMB20]
MFTISFEERASTSVDDFRWWRSIADAGSTGADTMDVPVSPLFEGKWCSIHRVSIGETPHSAKFRRSRHTLMIFDRGSFVHGERRIDSLRVAATGPLDKGVDFAPANSEFQAIAGPGSNIDCLMVSVDEGALDSFVGSDHEQVRLNPCVNLGGDLLLPLTDRLRQLCRSDTLYLDSIYLEALVGMLFREVKQAQNDSISRSVRCSGGLSSHARRIMRDFLAENLGQKIDLETLAEQVGLSRFHFTRAFKTTFGIPPYKYLLDLRIRKAADLLRSTQTPITAIALEVGFSCSSEFARAFRQAMNCTPREFRLINR